ncbi:MAG: hypothetical protein WCH34_13065, partial [Bacteroidota bacterium]
ATDSIIHYIEKLRNIDMPDAVCKKMEFGQAKDFDSDVEEGMNLLFTFQSATMAYPQVEYEKDTTKKKPSVLVISDSFYWGMFNSGVSSAFNNTQFWYYNQQVFPESYSKPLAPMELNLREEIMKYDVIILMSTDANLPGFGWGFIENLYNMFQGTESDVNFAEKLARQRKVIERDDNWMALIRKKAITNNITVDSMVTIDATWVLKNKNQK